ncbi:MAG: HET domain-containing protein [Gammaproteobacteria bacterium]
MDSTATPENLFRLLVPAGEPVAAGVPSLVIDGVRWVATPYTRIPESGAAPAYTCVSYSWGAVGEPNPLEPGSVMSFRTLPAIEATVRALRPSAIWVDAMCVPPHGAARTACLRSMGAIYARAAQVAAVLAPGSAAVLDRIGASGSLDEATLLLLENDEWVTRAWTYQEMVNGQNVQFIAEGSAAAAAGGEHLLNKVGEAIDLFKKAHRCSSFDFRGLHPRLDSLEDLIADWLTASYQERSAYQAMSSMDRRFAQEPGDHFNAMLGAITATSPSADELSLPAAEYFMRVCEAKGDFSFIYSSAPRSDVAGRHWRPQPGPLPALLPWHSFGAGQSGVIHPTHVELNHMCRVPQGRMDQKATQFIENWLDSEGRHAAERQRQGDCVVRPRYRSAGSRATAPGRILRLSRADRAGVRIFLSTTARRCQRRRRALHCRRPALGSRRARLDG